jgi:hypothetical protein
VVSGVRYYGVSVEQQKQTTAREREREREQREREQREIHTCLLQLESVISIRTEASEIDDGNAIIINASGSTFALEKTIVVLLVEQLNLFKIPVYIIIINYLICRRRRLIILITLPAATHSITTLQ